jgi:hypothetical protein
MTQATPCPSSVVFSQAPGESGQVLLSSLRDPDGSAVDEWAWDAFVFSHSQTITEIRWRGAYEPDRFGSGGPVVDFTVDVYASVVSGAQPDVSRPPLVHHEVGGNAGETPVAVLGAQTYDYRFVLPRPFEAASNTKYWVQIEALQAGSPDWGLIAAAKGDGVYFRRVPGEGANYQLIPGDAAFSVIGLRCGHGGLYLPTLLSWS